ncbi:BTAD domain-containing putative transcriptional regulator [Actinacidiphila sp. bgisy167]|uniref:AfsR/SARP family transcriptional regulator n=1 Tax=Actinacidiphila sp. bgisy167 TaxID=3413797 RepID=UPI003D71D8CA
MDLHFAVLGGIRARREGSELDLGSPQQRAVLALLLLRHPHAVPLGELVHQMWGENAPAHAGGTVRTYVHRLRRTLAAEGDPGRDAVLVSRNGGYSLRERTLDLDLAVFRKEIERAHGARKAGDVAVAAEHLRAALALWRGPALSGAHGEFVLEARGRLELERLAALEERMACDVELGVPPGLVEEIASEVELHPFRERLWELRLLALYRTGRRAEALCAYREVRDLLDAELGVDPGPRLRSLHQRVLRGDRDLSRPAPSAPARPAQLPADLPGFVGRSAEIQEVSALLSGNEASPVVAVTGLAGYGKTALAVHVAHCLRDRYPDGQVFADLDPWKEDRQDASAVLLGFLRAFGLARSEIPEGLHERAALWRATLSDRRVLVLLDNAEDGDQVRHLLPGSPGSAVIMTTGVRRMDLPNAHWVTVGQMRLPDAVDLLGALAGRQRLLREPQASTALADACSGQPLAIRVAASRLLTRPRWTVGEVQRDLVGKLGDVASMHDDCHVVGDRLRRAERRLTPVATAVFRLAAALGHEDITVDVATAVLGLPRRQVVTALEQLVDSHFIDTVAPGVYRYRRLVKAFAWRQAQLHDRAGCEAVLRRTGRSRGARQTQPPLSQ